MENKIGTDVLLEQFVELRNTIDLDVIGKVCRKYEVTISTTWGADGGVELFCCPWQAVGANDE